MNNKEINSTSTTFISLKKTRQRRDDSEIRLRKEAKEGNVIGMLFISIDYLTARKPDYVAAYVWLSKGVMKQHKPTIAVFEYFENLFHKDHKKFFKHYQDLINNEKYRGQYEWKYLGSKNGYLYLVESWDNGNQYRYKIDESVIDINIEPHVFGSGRWSLIKNARQVIGKSL